MARCCVYGFFDGGCFDFDNCWNRYIRNINFKVKNDFFYLFFNVSMIETAGNIGLGITQALGIIGIFQYAIRTLTEVETLMTSVERLE